MASVDIPGPSCLIASEKFEQLPTYPIYWHIDVYPTKDAAIQASSGHGVVAEAFDKIWLFTIAGENWRPRSGEHVSTIGPLPMVGANNVKAEYLRSTFSPGMTAPLHVHSGPEAFYTFSGTSCLETPDGMVVGGANDAPIIVAAGPPMLLMAVGTETRRGFALILHEETHPATTMVLDWTPPGKCQQLHLETAQTGR